MRILITLGLAFLPMLGCSSGPHDRWQSRGDRLLGIGSEKAEDPVSGAVIDKKDAVKQEHQGTTYYFESAATATTFSRNPTEYAIRKGAPVQSPSDSAEVR